MTCTIYILAPEGEKNGVIIFIIISVFGILCYLDIIPLRKQYYIFKIQFYGKYTRFKVRVVSAVDKVLRYWDI